MNLLALVFDVEVIILLEMSWKIIVSSILIRINLKTIKVILSYIYYNLIYICCFYWIINIFKNKILILTIFFKGIGKGGNKVFLRDIWPTRSEIQAVEKQSVIPAMFKQVSLCYSLLFCFEVNCNFYCQCIFAI